MPLTPYLHSLCLAAPRAKEDFIIYHCKISGEEFVNLLIAGRHCEHISFISCTILTDSECDFGRALDDATFKQLNLSS